MVGMRNFQFRAILIVFDGITICNTEYETNHYCAYVSVILTFAVTKNF